MLTFTNGRCNVVVVVVVSKTNAAFAPILQFHSTAVMNFVSADQVFSRADVPLRGEPGFYLLHSGEFGVVSMDALRKYEVRGFTYLPWSAHEAKRLRLRVTRAV